MTTDYHAEHVGSLLRPSWLLDARAARKQGRLGAEELAELQDRAALEAIELPRQAGIEVFTDGEVRRATWMAGLLESTGGMVPVELYPVPWHRQDGSPPASETDFDAVAAGAKVSGIRRPWDRRCPSGAPGAGSGSRRPGRRSRAVLVR
jgi:5-methyltetrahydropteroyltriglutamate--homocysteine methyltransferase